MMLKVLRLFTAVGLILMLGMFLSSLAEAGEPTLTVIRGAKDLAKIALTNEAPVRALQFQLTGVKITQVRTTDRTRGFLAKFNEQNGKIVLLSTNAEKIIPGKGPVLEVVCDKPDAAALSSVKIAGE